ncbi:MAG: hypothetical protein JWN88_214 [Frankiales bacterium]|nr:hypothetical protein [Frankiales bacterium]
MPESKKRKKKVSTSPTGAGAVQKKKGPSPRWLAPLMLVLFGIGVLWLVVYYIAPDFGGLPIASDLGGKNVFVGFGFIVAGFALSTQWR